MKALSTLKSAIDQSSFVGIIALALLFPVISPNIVSAAALQTSEQSTAQVFKINVSDPSLLVSAPKQNSVSLTDIQSKDPLFVNLHNFLQQNNSPLADFTGQLLSHDNWKTVVSISFVESNMCVHNLSNNCSGIGGPGHFRKYNNFGEWIDDMSALLDSHYSGWTLAEMDGVYVQPYSYNWKLGSTKTLAQLTDLENTSNQQRADLAKANELTAKSNQELATIME